MICGTENLINFFNNNPVEYPTSGFSVILTNKYTYIHVPDIIFKTSAYMYASHDNWLSTGISFGYFLSVLFLSAVYYSSKLHPKAVTISTW